MYSYQIYKNIQNPQFDSHSLLLR